MKDGDSTVVIQDTGVLSDPLSFVHIGNYQYYDAGMYSRGATGNYWTLGSENDRYSIRLWFYSTRLYTIYGTYRGNAFAMRYKNL